MNNQQNQPFDPWFDSEDDAIAEDLRRAPIIQALAEECRKHEEGSEGWHVARHKLGYYHLSAVEQRKNAQSITQARPNIRNLGGLAFMGLVNSVMQAGLVAPFWLAHEMLMRFMPVYLADVSSWDSEKAIGKPYPTRKADGMRKEFLSGESMQFVIDVYKQLQIDPAAKVDATIEETAKKYGMGATKGRKVYDYYRKHHGFNPGRLTKDTRKRAPKRKK